MSTGAADTEVPQVGPYRPEKSWKRPEKSWKPHALPEGRNMDGRPVWEPPIFNYTQQIGDVFEKKKEAVLKYTNGDVARTCKIMDEVIEMDLVKIYHRWAWHNTLAAQDDEERRLFFEGLLRQINHEWDEDYHANEERDVCLWQNEDGTWEAMPYEEYERKLREFAGLYLASSASSTTEQEGETHDEGGPLTSPEGSDGAEEPSFPSQASTSDRSRSFPQPSTSRPTRVRSLSPSWRQPMTTMPLATANASETNPAVMPLALRLIALNHSENRQIEVQMRQRAPVAEEEVD